MRATDEDGVLLGQGVAERLDLKPGDTVTILLNTTTGALNTLDFTSSACSRASPRTTTRAQ